MYYIGIDIGGTNLKAGLVDENYRITATRKQPLQFTSMEQMGDTLAKMAIDLVEENHVPRDQVASVGMGFPGPVDDKRGVVIKTVNIPIRFMPVAEMFHRRWDDVPVHLGNDADCAALGEAIAGAGKEYQDVVMLTLGAGVGSGVILDGEICAGKNIGGNELGHMVIVENGETCTCGRRGCLEAYVSVRALIRDARAAAGQEMTPEEIFRQAASGDVRFEELIDRYARRLGNGLVNIVNIFRPQLILLGGELSEQVETLLPVLRGMLKEGCFGGADSEYPDIEIAALGNDAGVIGAAGLV